jgi:hypothetical protein
MSYMPKQPYHSSLSQELSDRGIGRPERGRPVCNVRYKGLLW